MSTFTPGPWAVDDDGIVYRNADVRHDYIKLASAWVEGAWVGSDGDEESRANARLIAAAPELLEALRDLVEASDAMHGTYGRIDARGYDEDHHYLHDKWAEDFLAERTDAARAAIAKATGGAA